MTMNSDKTLPTEQPDEQLDTARGGFRIDPNGERVRGIGGDVRPVRLDGGEGNDL